MSTSDPGYTSRRPVQRRDDGRLQAGHVFEAGSGEMDPRQLLARPATEVAPLLLGWRLSHRTAEGLIEVVLTEVEAYMGAADPASHAYRGPTPRNRSMFAGPGHLYVYRSYGLHWCCNVVTGPAGDPSAVLLRAGRVTAGLDLARAHRGATTPDVALARGPGCLAQALGIVGTDDGVQLLDAHSLRLEPAREPGPVVVSGPRVGISRATDRPWRYWLPDEPTVSGRRRPPSPQIPGARGNEADAPR